MQTLDTSMPSTFRVPIWSISPCMIAVGPTHPILGRENLLLQVGDFRLHLLVQNWGFYEFMLRYYAMYATSVRHCINYSADRLFHFRANHVPRSPYNLNITISGLRFWYIFSVKYTFRDGLHYDWFTTPCLSHLEWQKLAYTVFIVGVKYQKVL